MDSSANYLPHAKDAVKNATPESGDEEIVVFSNGKTNGPKSATPTSADTKKPTASHDGAIASESQDPGASGNNIGSTVDADGLTDAFKSLNVNGKPSSESKYDFPGQNDYRTATKYPTIAVAPYGDYSNAGGVDWHQQPKTGRKASDEAPYGRPLNASANDFQHRGAPGPAYPGYGAGGAYNSYQPGNPPMHGAYVPHNGYDFLGLSPTLTEPTVNGGTPNGVVGPGANGMAGGNGGPGARYRGGVANGAPDVGSMGLTLNGLAASAAGPAPYSPIPMSPSPLSLNPYAPHHHQIPYGSPHVNGMNGHLMGPYMNGPPNNASKEQQAANGVSGSAQGMGTPPGSSSVNVGGQPNGTANGRYAQQQLMTVPGMPYGVPQQGYYDDQSMYTMAGYGAPHMQHGHPMQHPQQYQMNVGPPGHPGTPQIANYGAYGMPPQMVAQQQSMMSAPQSAGATVPPTNSPGDNSNGVLQNGVAANGVAAAGGITGVINGLTFVNGVPQPNPDGTGPSANNRKLGLYKTELCRSWEEKGSCRYGPKCQFAHGEEEIRKVARHPKYKTEICRTFWLSGSCPYGKRCCFIHTDAPQNGTGGEPGKAGNGSGPSTAMGTTTSTAVNGAVVDGTSTPTHTRSTSTASDAAAEQPSSLLARISAKREGDKVKTPSPQGPNRVAPAHNRHLSTMSDSRTGEPDSSFTARPGHSHSASAHTLVTPQTFSAPNGIRFGSTTGTPTGVDGNGNLTPGSFWGHKRSASGGSATNGGWNGSGADTPIASSEQPPLRSIYASLTPTA